MSSVMVSPEWAEQECMWLAWPADRELWGDELGGAQREFVALCRLLGAKGGPFGPSPTRIKILVHPDHPSPPIDLFTEGRVEFVDERYGDIWLRDTGPIFASRVQRHQRGSSRVAIKAPVALSFEFNGWGGRYRLRGDNDLASRLARRLEIPELRHGFVLEGGALEFDGEGTVLTSRSCLLNPNRGSSGSEDEITRRLMDVFGVERVVWITEGLFNDHTDGHIDTVARFLGPGRVFCMEPCGDDDPNRAVLLQIMDEIQNQPDARGRMLTTVSVPSPGAIYSTAGQLLPASYANYVIANRSVVVPAFGVANDEIARRTLAEHFSDREVVSASAKALLAGGGTFHCITQHQPRIV